MGISVWLPKIDEVLPSTIIATTDINANWIYTFNYAITSGVTLSMIESGGVSLNNMPRDSVIYIHNHYSSSGNITINPNSFDVDPDSLTIEPGITLMLKRIMDSEGFISVLSAGS